MKPFLPITRRGFAKTTASGAVALAANMVLPNSMDAADQDSSPGWIDAHVHVWHPNTEKYPISSRFKKASMQPPSFTEAELLAHSRPTGVQKIVLIQMSFYEHDHTYMIEVMQANPGVFSGVALIDYRANDLSERMDELSRQGMRGFRLYSRDLVAGVDDAGMSKLWSNAANDGLAVCPLINSADIRHVDALCRKFPETTVVVDHFARIGVKGTIDDESVEKLCQLSRFPKTHVKTSAFYALGNKTPPYTDLKPMIRKLLDAYGPERLMWATDCPYQVQGIHDYESSLALIRDHTEFLSSSDKQWILKGTAERVFFS